MCPGGALYGLLGWKRLLRVKLDAKACTGCRDCEPACPMGLNPVTQSASIECDNCGVCLHHCSDKALLYKVSVSARPLRRKKRTAAAAAVAMVIVLWPSFAAAHHILGLPHYSYKENYPQAPTLEYPATTGPYDVLMTSYPGKPMPGESANVTFYIKDRTDDTVYEQTVDVRVLRTATFGRNDTIHPTTNIEPFDQLHKLSVTFPRDGEYVVELSMRVEGQTEVIPFLLVVGEPTATGSILGALGGALVLFIIVVRAIRIKRARKVREAAA
jgi:ferredoxin